MDERLSARMGARTQQDKEGARRRNNEYGGVCLSLGKIVRVHFDRDCRCWMDRDRGG
jgi:hypothetical protein